MDAATLLAQTTARLRLHEGNYAEIARRTPALSYSWLTKLANGQISNPTVSNLQALIKALDAFEELLPPADKAAAQQAATP